MRYYIQLIGYVLVCTFFIECTTSKNTQQVKLKPLPEPSLKLQIQRMFAQTQVKLPPTRPKQPQ